MFIHTTKACSTKVMPTYKDWFDEQYILDDRGITQEQLYEMLHHDISTGIYYKILAHKTVGYRVDSYKSYINKAVYMSRKGLL